MRAIVAVIALAAILISRARDKRFSPVLCAEDAFTVADAWMLALRRKL